MSAVNPLPTSDSASGATEKRSYEPSMEEILASIRRIIADDQSLPKHPTIDPVAALTAAEPAPVPPPTASAPVPEPAPFPELRPGLSPLDSAPPNIGAAPAPVDMTQAVPASDQILESTPAPLAHDPLATYEPVAAPRFSAPHGPVGDDGGAAAVEEPVPPPEFRPAPAPAAEEMGPTAAPPSSVHELHPPLSAAAASLARDETPYETPIEPPRHRRPQPQLFSEETDTSVSSAFNLLAASRLADNSDELLDLAREMIKPLLRTWLDDNLPSMVERMVRAEIERVARGGR